MYFDPAGRVALLYERASKAIWSYDPEATNWTKLKPDGPAPPFGERERVLAYMDVARNAFARGPEVHFADLRLVRPAQVG